MISLNDTVSDLGWANMLLPHLSLAGDNVAVNIARALRFSTLSSCVKTHRENREGGETGMQLQRCPWRHLPVAGSFEHASLLCHSPDMYCDLKAPHTSASQ